jgi:hypothetical protein
MPRDLFLSDSELSAMQKYYIDTKAAAKKSTTKNVHNAREPGMAVANEVIDRCEDSYLAAKDYRIRVSKEHSDKGLIVVVCRHDRVIYFINMGPHGEKRFFMLAMMDKLLGELPETFTVGFLYDVICALHREMQRVRIFDFLTRT